MSGQGSLRPRAVVISRQTEYELLLDRHGTHGQVAFFLSQREREIDEVLARHEEQQNALQAMSAAIPAEWRRANVDRDDLSRWLFADEDLIIAVGQDGLVANVGKYLDGQSILGVNPSGSYNAGVLVPHTPAAAVERLRSLGQQGNRANQPTVSERPMVELATDTGQRLRAVNEIFLGQRSHQSARYTLALCSTDDHNGGGEFQSSSGILVSTGTGSTGWSRSLWNERSCNWPLPTPTAQQLAWFVREAWPSPSTGTSLVEGLLSPGNQLHVVAASDALVAFGDGIESDRIELVWGQEATIGLADQVLRLVL